MSRTPKEIFAGDVSIDCYPLDPDDMGGGHPGIQVEGFIYDEKQLNKVINALEKRRKWLAWETVGRWKTK